MRLLYGIVPQGAEKLNKCEKVTRLYTTLISLLAYFICLTKNMTLLWQRIRQDSVILMAILEETNFWV